MKIFTLQSGQSIISEEGNLLAKFQEWALQFNVNYTESLAMYIANDPSLQQEHFNTPEEAENQAVSGFTKIMGIKIPEL